MPNLIYVYLKSLIMEKIVGMWKMLELCNDFAFKIERQIDQRLYLQCIIVVEYLSFHNVKSQDSG